jgi:hypothetical protein
MIFQVPEKVIQFSQSSLHLYGKFFYEAGLHASAECFKLGLRSPSDEYQDKVLRSALESRNHEDEDAAFEGDFELSQNDVPRGRGAVRLRKPEIVRNY